MKISGSPLARVSHHAGNILASAVGSECAKPEAQRRQNAVRGPGTDAAAGPAMRWSCVNDDFCVG